MKHLTANEIRDHLNRGTLSYQNLALALEIADTSARSDIESFCTPSDADGFRWYDLASDDCEGNYAELAERWLSIRGKIIHDTRRPRLVRFKEST